MREYDEEFLNVFNEYYPFERYIFSTPKSLGMIFDDILITEIFVPYIEIKPILNDDGSLISHTKINPEDIYVKVKGNAGEMRICYFDFNDHVREEIRNIFILDFGDYEYESLYVDHEDDDNSTLIAVLNRQKMLIKEKYGICNIKKAVRDNLVNEDYE